MNLGAQYYRAPFPNEKYWEEDMARMRDSGLNTVQLWVLWAWVESKPNEFRFEDYDRLVELAGKNGLGVVLSTIAEIQPYWIHREVPGSEMINNMGNKVVSSNRGECHFGLTPGGCTDNPAVWDRMKRFLEKVVSRYRSADNLIGWDAWNELRWNVQSDGLVCFCEHTLKSFHHWLDSKYHGLDGLNSAWKRRYGSWDEVLPGKVPGRPYTEMMAFEHFLTWKACEHGKARYRVMKSIDSDHPVTLHGGAPSALYSGSEFTHALDRGNDWFFADTLDGIGCSSFPKWQNNDDADFGMRVELVKSAARDKRIWLSEVQGGRAEIGFKLTPSVDALSQQRWIWNGIACGAETILFWCWRDEVFGRESDGFGLIGNDGLAEERIVAMRRTGSLIEKHKDLLLDYNLGKAEVGVLFSPQAYYLYWAQEGNGKRPMQALTGYLRALVRKSISYTVIEEEHLEALNTVKILFLPRTIVTDDKIEKALEKFVKSGGTLVCESECGAFSPQGLYRYPEDRFINRLTGCYEIGRRDLDPDPVSVALDNKKFIIPAAQWLTPYTGRKGQALSEHSDGPLIQAIPVGKGRVILCGAYLGDAYINNPSQDFEDFVHSLVSMSGWKPDIEILSPKSTKESFVYVKAGTSLGRKVVFVFFPKATNEVKISFNNDYMKTDTLSDIISGEKISMTKKGNSKECLLSVNDWRFRVLVEGGL